MTEKIHAAMGNILKDCVPIAKDRQNKAQKFKYRGIDDAYIALNPLMAKYQVYTVPRVLSYEREEKLARSGGNLNYTLLMVEYDFICCEDGSKVTAGPVIGEAMDSGDKASGKALSMAHKAILWQTFMVPTHSEDPDATTYETAPSVPATDEQYVQLNDFISANQIPKRRLSWIQIPSNWKRLTEDQAATIIEECRGMQK